MRLYHQYAELSFDSLIGTPSTGSALSDLSVPHGLRIHIPQIFHRVPAAGTAKPRRHSRRFKHRSDIH